MTTWRLNRAGDEICTIHAMRKNSYGTCSACDHVCEEEEIAQNNEQDFEDAMAVIDGPVYDALRAIWNRLEGA